MNTAGIRRISHGTSNVRSYREMSNPRSDSAGRAAARPSGSQGRITRVARAAIEQVAGEPAQCKRRGVAASEQYRTGSHQIVEHRAVASGDQIFLQYASITRSETFFIDVYFYR